MMIAINAVKMTAQIAEVTAGLTCIHEGNVVLTQPLISAAAVISGTNARSNTARVESPRNVRSGQPSAPAAVVTPMPERKKPQAVESATGMMCPP